MQKIGLVIREGIEAARELGKEVILWARKRSLAVVCDPATATQLSFNGDVLNPLELTGSADPIITLGGDGTLIGIARHVQGKSPVLLGVNFGHLGFLTEVLPSELFNVLDDVLNGNAACEERCMLKASVIRRSKSIHTAQAVNDAVIQKGSRDKMLNLDINIKGEPLARVRGDGLIVSTPTGSTAYSLAAGGSILYPSLESMILTPICPHSLTIRPLVLPLDIGLKIEIPDFEGDVFLSLDGQDSYNLEPGDTIEITRSENVVKFVRSPSKSYFEILRTKLNWGVANKNE
ncbi:MAG: NAD(+)/NADH kinase [Candidatus Dadabacteria bacterium]|nr:MAG: NAD(+)/NADH kinase [Candidatus Dadabacteria bacterium]